MATKHEVGPLIIDSLFVVDVVVARPEFCRILYCFPKIGRIQILVEAILPEPNPNHHFVVVGVGRLAATEEHQIGCYGPARCYVRNMSMP